MSEVKDSYPMVSIITVNFNQSEITCQLLESLRNISYPNFEVIVVDNASQNDDPSFINKMYPEINFIASAENLGFAGGNNLGIKAAKGEYLLFLNNDTEVEKGFIEPLVNLLKINPSIGMVSPKIKFYYHPDTIQFAGYTPLNKVTLRNHLVGYRQTDSDKYNVSGPTHFSHGAAMIVPRHVIDEVGPMYEDYFLYYEELDWGTRIKNAGYDIWYKADSLVYHKESISTGKNSPLKTYYLSRNRLLYARKNLKGFTLITNLAFQFLVSAPKNLIGFLFKGDKDHFKSYLDGISWHLSLRKQENIFN